MSSKLKRGRGTAQSSNGGVLIRGIAIGSLSINHFSSRSQDGIWVLITEAAAGEKGGGDEWYFSNSLTSFSGRKVNL